MSKTPIALKKGAFLSTLEFLMVFFLFEPTFLKQYKLINVVYGAIGLVIFAISIIMYITYVKKFSLPLIVLVCFRGVETIMTIANDGDIFKSCYNSITFLSIFIIGEVVFKQGRAIKFIKNISCTLIILLTFNLGLQWIGISNFLGIRTRITDFCLPLIFCLWLEFALSKHINLYKFILASIITMLNLIYYNVTTAWIAIFLILIIYLIMSIQDLKKIFTKKFFLITCSSLVILILVFNIQEYFSVLLVKITGKNATFSNRTLIWDLSYAYIKEKVFMGHGLVNNGDFVYIWSSYTQAHNTYLQILYDTGIVGLIMFAVYFISSSIKKASNEIVEKIITAFLACLIVIMIVEVYYYYLFFYIITTIAYCVGKYPINDKKRWIYE